MDLIFKGFYFLKEIYLRFERLVNPDRAFSWQTLLYLSIFSWVMAELAEGIPENIIGFCGWIFLIASTAWYTTDNPLRIFNIPVGALITGALVSVFIMGGWEEGISVRTLILWPTITALITAVPDFIESGKGRVPVPEERQRELIIIGIGFIISCWFQFYYVIETWLENYPTLLADDFSQSAFVERVGFPNKRPENGVLILDKIDPVIRQQISQKPWPEVERWLLESKQRVPTLGNEVIENYLAKYEEKALWRIESRVTGANAGYNLQLLSIWQGPTAYPRYLSKSCQITPVIAGTNTIANPANAKQRNIVANIICEPVTDLIPGVPPPQQ